MSIFGKALPITILLLAAIYFISSKALLAPLASEGDRTYIIDRTGERWDITQAVSLGFEPGWFQYGIGKNAFRPLDDRDIRQIGDSMFVNPRVIGIAIDVDSHAYSVPKLMGHEIANTTIGSEAITVGY